MTMTVIPSWEFMFRRGGGGGRGTWRVVRYGEVGRDGVCRVETRIGRRRRREGGRNIKNGDGNKK